MVYRVQEPPYDPKNLPEYLSRELRRVQSALSEEKEFNSGQRWSVGYGSPEGDKAAPIGSVYGQIDGTAGKVLWVKESGTGVTGWVAMRTWDQQDLLDLINSFLSGGTAGQVLVKDTSNDFEGTWSEPESLIFGGTTYAQFQSDGSLSVPAALDKGIKVSPEDTFGWRDITTQITVRGTGSTDPTWSQIGSSSFWAYKFDVNDQAWMAFHIPHDIASSTVFFHAHWITDGTNAANVKWEWVYTYAKGFNQAAFSVAGTTVTAEQAGAGVAYRHMVTETTGATISGLTEPDGIIYVRIRRVTNGGVDNTDGVFLLTSDIHYQSNNMATVNKAPGFYG